MKTILSISIITIVLLGAGCTQQSVSPDKLPRSSSTSSTISHEEYRTIPDRLEWKTNQDVKNKIIYELRNGKRIHELVRPRSLIIPSDIYSPQFVKFFELGEMQFAIVQVLSRLTLGTWDEKTTHNTGIWYADKDDTIWKPLVILTHSNGDYPHNTIFDFWNEENKLKLMIIDSYGGGSGEGTAKVVGSSELDKGWHMEQCFYFAGELYDLQKKLGITSAHETIPLWLDPKVASEYKNIIQEYRFNSATKKFESRHFDTIQEKEVFRTEENCYNISFSN